jgi:hypothetical protein
VLDRAKPHMSDEHFTAHGTLIDAWAGHKEFPAQTARESRRAREERSTSRREAEEPNSWNYKGPDARLFRKSKGEARLPGTCIDGKPQLAFGVDTAATGITSGPRCGIRPADLKQIGGHAVKGRASEAPFAAGPSETFRKPFC